MSLSMTARRANRFADLLDSGARTDDPALAPFAALAGALRAVPAPAGPAPEFRAALRQRLVAVATVQGVGVPAPSTGERLREAGATWKVQRRMAVLAGGAAAVTAIAGIGVGASRSLPGDPFYGVKRATERIQLAATTGREAQGKRHLEFARTRLAEVEALAGHPSALPVGLVPGIPGAAGPLTDSGNTSEIVATLRDMDSETRAGATDLFAVYRDTGSAEPLQTLDAFTRAQFAQLRAVLPTLDGVARARAETSLSLLAIVARHTVALAVTPPGATPGTTTPGHPTPDTSPSGTQPSAGAGGGSSAPTTGGGSSTPGTGPAPAPVPTTAPSLPVPSVSGQPVPVPTIPTLPTVLPQPTILPTTLPTLPTLPSLPGLG